MELSDISYDATTCPPELKAGRIGGAFGGSASKEVTQQCVRISATMTNPTKAPLVNVAVFGFVLDELVSGFVNGPVGYLKPYLNAVILIELVIPRRLARQS